MDVSCKSTYKNVNKRLKCTRFGQWRIEGQRKLSIEPEKDILCHLIQCGEIDEVKLIIESCLTYFFISFFLSIYIKFVLVIIFSFVVSSYKTIKLITLYI